VTPEAKPNRPVLRIVRGEPTDEDLAALVALLTARTTAAAPPKPQAPSVWRDRATLLRKPVHPGAGAWRAATWRL
jgi:hypothetical protein